MKNKEQHPFSFIERLLDGAEVEWTTLGDTRLIEIANNNRKPVKSSNRKVGNIPYYGANNIQDYVNGYTHNGTYILVAEDGTAPCMVNIKATMIVLLSAWNSHE